MKKEFSKITYVERIFVFGSRARGDYFEWAEFVTNNLGCVLISLPRCL